MADLDGSVRANIVVGPVPDAQTTVNQLPPTSVQGFSVFAPVGQGSAEDTGDAGFTPVTFDGYLDPGLQQHWFELVHAHPAFFELGNILATLTRDLEIYNAYRDEARTVTAFTNNADSGVTLVGFPGLPTDIEVNNGLLFEVRVSSSGPPELDGTLDFTLDVVSLSVPIAGTRVVMFPYEPETPMLEELEFKTDVITGMDSSEQRISVRKHPRQVVQVRVKTEDDDERRRLQALMSSWHPRVFGLPIWFEARPLTSAITALDTTVQVDTTYGDFRVGSLAIIWQDSETLDSLEIDNLTDTSITFSSPVSKSYLATALVMPLRVAVTGPQLGRVKWAVNLSQLSVQFTVLDNEADIGDTSAFSTHNSKVMLDDPNLMGGETHDDGLMRQVERLDNKTGSIIQYSDWDNSLPVTKKGFLGEDMQAVWEARQLVHGLRGSQTSFYLPTFYNDLEVVQNLASGSVLMDIANIGYTSYLDGAEPNRSLWVELVSGTVLTRQVVGAAEVDADVERLTVDSSWPSTITPAEINRVSFLQLVRIADDRVRFEHTYAGNATIRMDILGVTQ